MCAQGHRHGVISAALVMQRLPHCPAREGEAGPAYRHPRPASGWFGCDRRGMRRSRSVGWRAGIPLPGWFARANRVRASHPTLAVLFPCALNTYSSAWVIRHAEYMFATWSICCMCVKYMLHFTRSTNCTRVQVSLSPHVKYMLHRDRLSMFTIHQLGSCGD